MALLYFFTGHRQRELHTPTELKSNLCGFMIIYYSYFVFVIYFWLGEFLLSEDVISSSSPSIGSIYTRFILFLSAYPK